MSTQEIIRTIIYIVITGILVPLTKYLVTLLQVKAGEIATTIQDEKVKGYLDSAVTAISNAVVSVNQTYVDSLKKAGKFDEAAQREAKEKAIEVAKKLITENARDAIKEIYGDFDQYLDTTIEALVRENK